MSKTESTNRALDLMKKQLNENMSDSLTTKQKIDSTAHLKDLNSMQEAQIIKYQKEVFFNLFLIHQIECDFEKTEE